MDHTHIMSTVCMLLVGFIAFTQSTSQGAPEVIPEGKVTVLKGDEAVLSCPYQGEWDDVIWYRGRSISEEKMVARVLAHGAGEVYWDPLNKDIASLNQRTGQLTIKRARFNDQSWYTCVVDEQVYFISLVVDVNTLLSPLSGVNDQQTDVIVVSGYSATESSEVVSIAGRGSLCTLFFLVLFVGFIIMVNNYMTNRQDIIYRTEAGHLVVQPTD